MKPAEPFVQCGWYFARNLHTIPELANIKRYSRTAISLLQKQNSLETSRCVTGSTTPNQKTSCLKSMFSTSPKFVSGTAARLWRYAVRVAMLLNSLAEGVPLDQNISVNMYPVTCSPTEGNTKTWLKLTHLQNLRAVVPNVGR